MAAVIATAAWSIPKTVAARFPAEGLGLSRYAAVFRGVEVNSTFYRSHRPSTFARWADCVPGDFRFAVKMPKEITHERRLSDIGPRFGLFLEEIAPLGAKTGPLLCQLPPSHAFEPAVVAKALEAMRSRWPGQLVIEVRHRSWNTPDALRLLEDHAVGRVLADPAPVWTVEDFTEPVAYMRLHGSPKIYYSSYTHEQLAAYRQRLAADGWCVLDNTASGAAIENALEMLDMPEPAIAEPGASGKG